LRFLRVNGTPRSYYSRAASGQPETPAQRFRENVALATSYVHSGHNGLRDEEGEPP
jgi:hypothetical protein